MYTNVVNLISKLLPKGRKTKKKVRTQVSRTLHIYFSLEQEITCCFRSVNINLQKPQSFNKLTLIFVNLLTCHEEWNEIHPLKLISTQVL